MTHEQKIGEIDLSYPLSGREGVDPNHASRIRVQTLLDQHSSLIQQTQFADAKSGGLITVIGLLALNGPLPLANMMTTDYLSMAGGIIAVACMLFCVLTIFPRYPSGSIRKSLAETDRFSWPSLTAPEFDAEAYSKYMHTAEVSQIVHSIAHSNSAVSKILLRKFQTLRIAFFFGAVFFLIVLVRHAGLA
jgi:Pycsar effector protein